MITYFTATTEGAALDALTAPLNGAETVESSVVPDSNAFTFLIELVRGDALLDDHIAAQVALVHTADGGERVLRLGALVRDGIADADQATLQDLAGLWAANAAVKRLAVDPENFLTDLQHLCRNARAISGDVYAIERL